MQYDYDYTPYMKKMGLPMQYYPMVTMPAQDLESMYPKMYYIIYPCVKKHCDKMEMQYGPMYTPTREELDDMVERIYKEVEMDLEKEMKGDMDKDGRQFGYGFGGRRFFGDIISILLLRDLFRRRRRRPYYGGGYGGGFPGYFGY